LGKCETAAGDGSKKTYHLQRRRETLGGGGGGTDEKGGRFETEWAYERKKIPREKEGGLGEVECIFVRSANKEGNAGGAKGRVHL